MHLAPIVLFVYNRPWHTRRTVEALQQNEFAIESDLIIFSDGSKDTVSQEQVAKVRHYIHKIDRFKSVAIVERRKNLGLAKSVITGVTDIIEKYGRAIVLEDDLLTSPYFLAYMNNGLNTFKDESRVFSITGFNLSEKIMTIPRDYKYGAYFSPRASSWSWGSWKNRWEKVDWTASEFPELVLDKSFKREFNFSGNDRFNNLIAHMNGKIDSWAIRWDLAHHKHNAYCVYPLKSFVHNTGNDGTGIHCVHKKINIFKNDLKQTPQKVVFPEKFLIDNHLIRNYARLCSKGLFYKLYKFYKIIFNYTYWKN
jgi:hypothetical protein